MNNTHYIYIDESGDLGFDFTHPKTSRYFIMTALTCSNSQVQLVITRAIKKTMKNKVTEKIHELKGSNTNLSVKNYFYRHIREHSSWSLFIVIVDKKIFLKNHKKGSSKIDKGLFYDAVACMLLEKLNYSRMTAGIAFVLDRSKSQEEIEVFNERASKTVKKHLQDRVRFTITHATSFETHMLQAVDLFCWGIQRKYELLENEWYEVFKEKIEIEEICRL